MSERDTHFRPTAELIVQEMQRHFWIDEWFPDASQDARVFLAQCLFDFATHCITALAYQPKEAEVEQAVKSVPALTTVAAWIEPEEE